MLPSDTRRSPFGSLNVIDRRFGSFLSNTPFDVDLVPPQHRVGEQNETGSSGEEPVEGSQGAGYSYPGLVLRSDSVR